MNKFKRTAGAALIAALFATAATAQNPPINGEVKKIDESAGKITLKHGLAKSLGMDEGMTMVYKAQDPAMLGAIKSGDKIRFDADQVNGQYTVKRIEKAK